MPVPCHEYQNQQPAHLQDNASCLSSVALLQPQSHHIRRKYCLCTRSIYAWTDALRTDSWRALHHLYLFRKEKETMTGHHTLVPLLAAWIVVQRHDQVDAVLKILVQDLDA